MAKDDEILLFPFVSIVMRRCSLAYNLKAPWDKIAQNLGFLSSVT